MHYSPLCYPVTCSLLTLKFTLVHFIPPYPTLLHLNQIYSTLHPFIMFLTFTPLHSTLLHFAPFLSTLPMFTPFPRFYANLRLFNKSLLLFTAFSLFFTTHYTFLPWPLPERQAMVIWPPIMKMTG